MTLPDLEEGMTKANKMGSNSLINSALISTLKQATKKKRLTVGAYECAKLLETDCSSAVLCVLPVVFERCDPTVLIQHTLMEAFCWEYKIPLLKVDSPVKLWNVVSNVDTNTSPPRMDLRGVNCVLLHSPMEKFNAAEQIVVDFYQKMISTKPCRWPIIELQV